jgi:hypothetical protein
MSLYKLTDLNNILRTLDNAIIPIDMNNKDYRGYLAWSAIEGNTVDPVDTLSLEGQKYIKWEEFKSTRDTKTAAGFTSDGVVYDSDPISIGRIGSSVQIATICKAGGAPFIVEWTLKDNTTKTLDADEMIQVGLDCMAFAQVIFAQGVDYREQINAATTQAQLDAIVWTEV